MTAHPLTNSAADYDLFQIMAMGHNASMLIWAGIDLDLFTRLADQPGLTKADLASSIGVPVDTLHVVLFGLTALGVLRKQGDQFFNSELAMTRLNRNHSDNMIPYLAWQHHVVYRGMFHFAEAVRQYTNVGLKEFPGEGNTIYERLASHPMEEKVFHDAMSDLSLKVNPVLVKALDWSKYSVVVDAGGGDGSNLISLAQNYPDLKGIIFDQPSVCKLAVENIAQKGLSDRISTHEGNFLTDPFPPNIDCVIFIHMFNIYSAAANQKLLSKVYESLNPGGAVVIYNTVANEDDTGPIKSALASPYFLSLATGEGMIYSSREYKVWLDKAGFSTVDLAPAPLDHGLIVGTK